LAGQLVFLNSAQPEHVGNGAYDGHGFNHARRLLGRGGNVGCFDGNRQTHGGRAMQTLELIGTAYWLVELIVAGAAALAAWGGRKCSAS
jgi:hypothetical protein